MVELKIYRSSPEYQKYINARFDKDNKSISVFKYNGNFWMYRYASFDEGGEYVLLFRHESTKEKVMREINKRFFNKD